MGSCSSTKQKEENHKNFQSLNSIDKKTQPFRLKQDLIDNPSQCDLALNSKSEQSKISKIAQEQNFESNIVIVYNIIIESDQQQNMKHFEGFRYKDQNMIKHIEKLINLNIRSKSTIDPSLKYILNKFYNNIKNFKQSVMSIQDNQLFLMLLVQKNIQKYHQN